MFVPVVGVPALLVVVFGYVVGHGLRTWIAGMVDAGLGTSLTAGAEAAGWITGLLGLAGAVRFALGRRRRARSRPD